MSSISLSDCCACTVLLSWIYTHLSLTPNNNKAQKVCAFPFVLPFGRAQVVDMSLHGEHGSAWRRRQRRLRSWWRHEQQSVAMALSAAGHHSFDKVAAGEKYDGLRAQKTDRAGEAANRAVRRQKSKAAVDAVFFELFDEDTAGVRPEVLAEPRPPGRVQRHSTEHIVDFVSCAAVGGTAARRAPVLRHAHA